MDVSYRYLVGHQESNKERQTFPRDKYAFDLVSSDKGWQEEHRPSFKQTVAPVSLDDGRHPTLSLWIRSDHRHVFHDCQLAPLFAASAVSDFIAEFRHDAPTSFCRDVPATLAKLPTAMEFEVMSLVTTELASTTDNCSDSHFPSQRTRKIMYESNSHASNNRGCTNADQYWRHLVKLSPKRDYGRRAQLVAS